MRTWMLRDFLQRASHLVIALWAVALSGLVPIVIVVPTCSAADVVQYSRSATGTPVRQTGTILDYTGRELTLELVDGKRVQIPTDRVIAIETTRVDAHQAANRLLADGHPAQALTLYRRAVREETRTWMRRWILADTCRCYAQLGQVEQACDTFSILVGSDPQTPWFDAIPLCWTAQTAPPDLYRRFVGKLQSGATPIEQLCAASWLLTSTAERGRAIECLQQLATQPDARVAGLATAQLWRTTIATATATDAAQWQSQLAKTPPKLRGGPYYLLGQLWGKLGNRQESALTFMRVPILFGKQRNLAAEALWAAGQQLEQLRQNDEAINVYRELANHHDDNPLAANARQRIESLTKE